MSMKADTFVYNSQRKNVNSDCELTNLGVTYCCRITTKLLISLLTVLHVINDHNGMFY